MEHTSWVNRVRRAVGQVGPLAGALKYGTAGFRAKATLLSAVMLRVGVVAALRSKQMKQSVGVMITASHNPVEDNGVKIIDPNGEMLVEEWEQHATGLANAGSADNVIDFVNQIASKYCIDLGVTGSVFVGTDTRYSSPALWAFLARGVEALGCTVKTFNNCTTPQLHFAVRRANDFGFEPFPAIPAIEGLSSFSEHHPFFTEFVSAFRSIVALKDQLRPLFAGLAAATHSAAAEEPARSRLILDCADGVGGIQIHPIREALADVLDLDVINDARTTLGQGLNDHAGAEFVQKDRKFPRSVDLNNVNVRHASLDGDADRLVYFYFGEDKQLQLVDGDKIATLAALFVQKLAASAGVTVSVGVVQTAYANGASSYFLRNTLGVQTAIVPTGVKYLHHEAKEFDVGIYFEANGHGTVLFSPRFNSAVNDPALSASVAGDATRSAALRGLQLCPRIFNQAIGDALADLLAVEAILAVIGWNAQEWNALYTDLPSRQLKLAVPDRTQIKTTWDETKTTAPEGLQADVDARVATAPSGRSFVRPSGTEDVVRVYAEAATDAEAARLGDDIISLVKKHLHC